MRYAYLLEHNYGELDDFENLKILGIYASKKKANDAIKRFSRKPGFKKHKNGFHIDKYVIDEDCWASGFI
jgi:hypothetical protein